MTLQGAVGRPGVYEVEIGLPLAAALERAGGPVAPPGIADRRLFRQLGSRQSIPVDCRSVPADSESGSVPE